MTRILFVCTGNICRSPSAEAIFREAVKNSPLAAHVAYDSAGTQGYHEGEAPDPRAVATAQARGYAMQDLVARQVTEDDFYRFDLIFAMDRGHLRELQALRPRDAEAEIVLFLPYAGVLRTEDVPDPYYGSEQGFETTFDLIEQGVQGIIHQLERQFSSNRQAA